MIPPRPLVAMDVDGVVADARHRLHLIEGNPAHEWWVKFFDAASDDKPLATGIEFAQRLTADYHLVWVTGRPARLHALTAAWLQRHGLPSDRIVMQADNDYRPSRVVKLEHLARLGGSDEVQLVVDDDPRVVDAVRAAGYIAIQADWCGWRNVTGEPAE